MKTNYLLIAIVIFAALFSFAMTAMAQEGETALKRVMWVSSSVTLTSAAILVTSGQLGWPFGHLFSVKAKVASKLSHNLCDTRGIPSPSIRLEGRQPASRIRIAPIPKL